MDDGNTQRKERYSSAHAVYALRYHIVFCPKYRRKVLTPLEEELKQLFTQKATELGLAILAMEVMPDHVHIFIEGKPSYEPQFIVNQLKGYTSRILRGRHQWLRSRLRLAVFLQHQSRSTSKARKASDCSHPPPEVGSLLAII